MEGKRGLRKRMEEGRGLVMKEMAYWVRKVLGRKWCGHFVSSK